MQELIKQKVREWFERRQQIDQLTGAEWAGRKAANTTEAAWLLIDIAEELEQEEQCKS